MPRKVVLCMVICAALVSGCAAHTESVPTTSQAGPATQEGGAVAPQVGPVIQERGAVARQYWAATRAYKQARLGFKERLEVAVGNFTTCGTGGEQYQIVAVWEPAGPPIAEQGGLLAQAVPVVERAFNKAGWSRFRPSPSIALNVVATRQGITLSLDADPADPAPLERDWVPSETYTVSGPCAPVTALAAIEFGYVPRDYYGTTPTALSPVQLPTTVAS